MGLILFNNFSNDLEEEVDSSLLNFTNHIKLESGISTNEDRKIMLTYLESLEIWIERKIRNNLEEYKLIC